MRLFDTLSSSKREFISLDDDKVKLYVCGPTVYDLAHIGNARSAVVYDVLFRLLNSLYSHVTYVRNITDVDDKIIDAAQTSNTDIFSLSEKYIKAFHQDMAQLNCLPPTIEPKATKEINVMIDIITTLLNSGHAYVKNRSVYFKIHSFPHYGKLSGRRIDEMISGSRVAVEEDKIHPGDFVLWKPSTAKDETLGSSWNSPWGKGRPGWHIECSAMSSHYLGESFL